jgi:hypothetical protein
MNTLELAMPCLHGNRTAYATRDLSLDHGVARTFVSVAVASREKLERRMPTYTCLFMRFLMRESAYVFNIVKVLGRRPLFI